MALLQIEATGAATVGTGPQYSLSTYTTPIGRVLYIQRLVVWCTATASTFNGIGFATAAANANLIVLTYKLTGAGETVMSLLDEMAVPVACPGNSPLYFFSQGIPTGTQMNAILGGFLV